MSLFLALKSDLVSSDGETTEIIGAAIKLMAANALGKMRLSDDELADFLRWPISDWMKNKSRVWTAMRSLSGGAFILEKPDRNVSPVMRQIILDRDGEACRYCDTTDGPWHIDHVTPLALGGSNLPENLCVSCAPCNLSKGPNLP